MKARVIFLSALVFLGQSGLAQGFINLNFESAHITNGSIGLIDSTSGFPGWTVTPNYCIYDNLSLSGNSISIFDTNAVYAASPVQGKYKVFLNSGNYPGTGIPISIGQTGRIPITSQSITFWGSLGALQITFDGQPLSFTEMSSTVNYSVYGADVSAFAGQVGNLLFTLPPYDGYAIVDNIQFSSSPVPEPGQIALFALGGALLGLRRKQ